MRTISCNEVKNITISIDNGVDADWVAGVDAAISQWNSTGKVNLSKLSGQGGDVRISISNWGSFEAVIAQSTFPGPGGQIGNSIRLRADLSPYPSLNNAAAKKAIMIHEFGHTLGLTHTDTNDGSHISGTPTTDSQSIMVWNANDIAKLPGANGNDKKAIKKIYKNCK